MSHGTHSVTHGAKMKIFAMAAVVLAVVLCVFTLVGPALAEDADGTQADTAAVVAEPAADTAAEPAEDTSAAVVEESAEPATTDEATEPAAETSAETTTESATTPAKVSAFRAASTPGDELEIETEYEPMVTATPAVTVAYVNAPDDEPITGTVQYKFISGTSTPTDTGATYDFTVDANGSVTVGPNSQTLRFYEAGTYTFEYSQGIEGNYDLDTYRDGKNVLYDTEKRYITYTVYEKNKKLYISETVTDKDGNEIDPVITNRGPQYEDVYIPVQVVIQGRDWEAGDTATVSVTPTTGYGSWNNTDTFKSNDLTVDNGTFVVSDDTPNHTSGTYVSSTKHAEGTGYFFITETSAPTGTVLVNKWYARVDWKFDDTNVLRGYVYYGTTTNGDVFAPATAAQLINQIVRVPDPVNVDVTKDLVGREWTDGDSFKFTIEPYTYVPTIDITPSEGDDGSSGGNTQVVIQLPQNYGTATTVTDTPIEPVAEGASVEVPMTFTGLGKVGYVAPEVESTTEVAITADTPDKTASFELGFATFTDATYVIAEDSSAGEAGMTYADPVYVKVHWNDDGSYTLYYSTDPTLSEDSWTTEKPVFENVYEDPNANRDIEEIVVPTPDEDSDPTPTPDPKPEVKTTTTTKTTTKPATKATVAKKVVTKSATPKTGDAAMFAEFAVAGAALVGAAAAMGRKRK